MSVSSQTRSHAGTPTPRRPSIGWYWAAGLLLVAGLVAAAGWLLGAVTSLNDHVDRFARTTLPGETSVQIDQSDTYKVYYEGVEDITLDRLDVTLTDPSGEPVAVGPVNGRLLYDFADRAVGHAVGQFQASTTGTYHLTATGDASGTIAIGDGLTDDVLPPLIGAGLLLLLTSGGAITIAIVTGVRRSRPSTAW